MEFTSQIVEQIWYGEHPEFELIESLPWTYGIHFNKGQKIVKHINTAKYYRINVLRTVYDQRYDFSPVVAEVEQREVVVKKWVDVQ